MKAFSQGRRASRLPLAITFRAFGAFLSMHDAAKDYSTVRPLQVLRRTLSPTGNTGDAIFRVLLLAAATLILLIVVAMIVALAWKSSLSIRQFGFGFITGTDWDPVKSEFGALAFIYGTVVSSLISCHSTEIIDSPTSAITV